MTDPAPVPPVSVPDIVAFARLLIDLDLPEVCVEGVRSNLVALADHVRRLEGKA